MKDNFSSNIDYICLFLNEKHVWYGRLLNSEYQHCTMIIRCRNGWYYLDPLLCGLISRRLGNVTAPNLLEVYLKIGYRIVYGQRRTRKNSRKIIIKPSGCVEMSKKLIGISAPLAITPLQLKGYLIRKGYGVEYTK